MKKVGTIKELLKNNLIVITAALIVMCVLLSIFTDHFATKSNLAAILSQMSVNGILAIGMTCCLIVGGIDLSVGSILSLSGIVCAICLRANMSVVLSILIAVLVGALCGMINGSLVAKGNVPPFIATLGMTSIAAGMALILSNGRPISGATTKIMKIGAGRIGGVLPISFLIMCVCFIIAHYMMKYTRTGRYIYTIGGSKEAAKLSGIDVTKYTIIPYVLSGVFCAIAAVIVTGRLNSAEPLAGSGMETDAIAAAIIGGTSMSGGEGTLIGTFIGAMIMSVVKNGLVQMGVGTYPQQVIIGLIIIAVVLIDMINRTKSKK